MFDWIKKRITRHPAEVKESLASHDPSRNHKQRRAFWQYDDIGDLPIWTMRFGRQMLRNDPIVRFSLNVRNSILSAGEVVVESDDARVGKWVTETWKKLWENHRRELSQAKKWGYYGVQVLYEIDAEGLLQVKGLKEFAPEDQRILEVDNDPVGFSLRREIEFFAPQAIPFTFDASEGEIYGNPLLRRMYPPWYEKWMDRGAVEVKIMRLIKDSYRSDQLKYPKDEYWQLPDGEKVPARDVARELIENMLNGSGLIVPSDSHASGGPKWEYSPPHDSGNPTGIFDWEKGLDEKILLGADIPSEVVKAAETGSGFSGRSVPFMVLIGVCNEEFSDIVQQVCEYVLKPVALLNFGTDDFDISPVSLLETTAEDTQGSQLAGGTMGGQQPQGGQQRIPSSNGNGSANGATRSEGASPTTMFSEAGPINSRKSIADEISDIAQRNSRKLLKETGGKLRDLLKKNTGLNDAGLFSDLRNLLHDLGEGMRRQVYESTIVADLVAAADTLSESPVLSEILSRSDGKPPGEGLLTLEDIFGEPPRYEWPVVEDALEVLQQAETFTSRNYLEVAERAKEGAFAVTSDLTEETIGDMRDLLMENIAKGPDREKFIEDAEELLGSGSGLSEARLNQVFRNNVNTAYSNAQERSLASPLVADAFPFRAYYATTDGRVRKEHIALETLGLNGTNIYWSDDPTWRKFRPPWDYGCRCTSSPVTVRQAAAAGVRQAKEWLTAAEAMAAERGGEPVDWFGLTEPIHEFVKQPPFDVPETWTRDQSVQFAESWTAYKGPRGGTGWRNVRTGEVVYGDRPGEGETAKKSPKPNPSKTKTTPKKTEKEKEAEFERFLKSKSPADAKVFRKARKDGVSIPPAWSNVQYYGADKDIIAEGRDDKGRKQRAENPAYRQGISDKNNARITKELKPRMDALRKKLRMDAIAGDEESKVLYLISLTGFRIGGKGDGKAKTQAYGASTLTGDHVSVNGDTVTFDFPGKKGVRQHHIVNDPVVAKMVKDAKPGEPIFSTRDTKVRDAWQNKYNGTKVHDIRHVVATEIAEGEMEKITPPPPKNERERTKMIKQIATIAAETLGNNPSQTLGTYIDPQLWQKLEIAA